MPRSRWSSASAPLSVIARRRSASSLPSSAARAVGFGKSGDGHGSLLERSTAWRCHLCVRFLGRNFSRRMEDDLCGSRPVKSPSPVTPLRRGSIAVSARCAGRVSSLSDGISAGRTSDSEPWTVIPPPTRFAPKKTGWARRPSSCPAATVRTRFARLGRLHPPNEGWAGHRIWHAALGNCARSNGRGRYADRGLEPF